MTWPYIFLTLRMHFGIAQEEFCNLTYWQARGYLLAIPYALGTQKETSVEEDDEARLDEFLRKKGRG